MDNLKNRMKKGGGFTLVELLVVIAIIAILSVTAYVALGGQTGKARDSRRQSDLAAVQNALEIYFINNSSKYPGSTVDLTPGLMPKLPTDPSTADDYNYEVAGNKKSYQLGATLESDDGTYSAYVIGNSGTDILVGIDVPDTGGCNGNSPTDGSTDCVPMNIWD